MEGGRYGALSSNQLLGSVPAVVINEEKTPLTGESSRTNPRTFAPGTSYDGADRPAGNSWTSVFSVSSYTPYFNVDTDIVADRIISSINSFRGDFFGKIDANPDLYGPVWISTTLIFMLAFAGNCASYLIQKKKSSTDIAWKFDVSYFNLAAFVIYGYTVVIPTGFYFLFQYLGVGAASLVRLWCMWGYSLFVFIPCSLIMVIPVAMIRWLIIIVAGASSGTFIAMNLKTYTEDRDLMVMVASAFLLQFALALFIEIYFFG